jgi:hypothetical protein
MKEYFLKDYPHLDYIYDYLLDNYAVDYQENFIYDGKVYHASIQYDGTYLEYGIPGREVIINEI